MYLSDPSLTVIIPIRAVENRQVVERLDYPLEDTNIPKSIEFLVVDDGSPVEFSNLIRKKSEQNGFKYIRTNTEFEPWSIARSRNVGAMHSSNDFIIFQDVDLIPYPGFYQDALNEIIVQDLYRNCENFIMFGVIYLSQLATEEFLKLPPNYRREIFLQKAYVGDSKSIEKISTGTSVTIFNREYYLSRGGNSEEFYEWGFDDLEFACRCMRRAAVFPLPEEFLKDFRNFSTITEYRGWKAPYRLFGDMTFKKGKVLFHAWHPVDEKSDYQLGRKRNEKLFKSKLEAFSRFGSNAEPDPLPSLCEGKTLIFSETNPFIYNRDTLPRLGKIFLENENEFTARTFVKYIRKHGIDRVLFHNPYASLRRTTLYKTVRRLGIPYIVAERGALPNSVFFDPDGFLCDSRSYSAKNWDKPLSEERLASVKSYVLHEKQEDEALEAQGNRIGAKKIRKKLKIKPHQKVLFVPLQRPADTVIKFQSGPIKNFSNFIGMVRETREKLGSDWAVVLKKHPLEDDRPDIPGVIYADEAHFKDLLELSDSVFLINSGVGVLSMVWGKPVFYAGNAWYGHPSLNRQVLSADELIEYLENGFAPDQDKVLRFLSYLVHDFYSFGHFTTRESSWKEGGRMTVTTGIEFYQIRGLGKTPFNARKEKKPIITWESILFDRYRFAMNAKKPTSVSNKEKNEQNLAPVIEIPISKKDSYQKVSEDSASVSKNKKNNILRKIKKLRESPHRFFSESRFSALRSIGAVLFRI